MQLNSPTVMNGCPWRPARAADSLEELQPPKRAFILRSELKKKKSQSSFSNLLQGHIVPVLIVGAQELLQPKALSHHTWTPVNLRSIHKIMPFSSSRVGSHRTRNRIQNLKCMFLNEDYRRCTMIQHWIYPFIQRQVQFCDNTLFPMLTK